jgi:hypothetical protein
MQYSRILRRRGAAGAWLAEGRRSAGLLNSGSFAVGGLMSERWRGGLKIMACALAAIRGAGRGAMCTLVQKG